MKPESNPELPSRRRILPDRLTHPATLLLVVAIPQLVLLFINLRAYSLMSGELDPEKKQEVLFFFAGELVLLVGGILLAAWRWRRGRRVDWAWNWLLFVPGVVYLSLFLLRAGALVPTDLQAWIVVPETLIFYQFVFLMPVVFLAMLGLACFPVSSRVGPDVGISVAAAAGVPLAWYVLLHLSSGWIFDRLPAVFATLAVVLSSLICLGAVLRILTMLFTWALRKGPLGQAILVGVVAIVAPVGGLLLNREIPFPADFQSLPLYVVVILNGILLASPASGVRRIDRGVWLAQCALFPVTLYFFLVFLPYLPIAALAMIAAGAGFLILAPSALFLIHLRRIVQRCPGRSWIPAGVVAVLVLPSYIAVEMTIDRVVLHRAIDHVYSPETDSKGRFDGSTRALRRSLERLQGVKKGVYLPFLTEWYEEAVLDGLVLNDEKLAWIYFSFFGESIPEPKNVGSGFGLRMGGANRFGRAVRPPERAVLEGFSHRSSDDAENGNRTLLRLELYNPGSRQAEFFTAIEIAPGAMVSGYWLHIGEERVPGMIFEKKTAMWVYRMIRDARRDPGLVTYRSPGRVELRVFPLAPGERRTTEIEFLSPPGHRPSLAFGGEVVSGQPSSESIVLPWKDDESGGGATVFLPPGPKRGIPRTERKPYFHFVIDRSDRGLDPEAASLAIRQVAESFPAVDGAVVGAANYEFLDAANEPTPIDEIDAASLASLLEDLPRRGGFLSGIALERAFRDAVENVAIDRHPVFVIVKSDRTVVPTPKQLLWWENGIPEVDRYFVATPTTKRIVAKSLVGKSAEAELPARPVVVLRSAGEIRVAPGGADAATVDVASGSEIEVHDPDGGGFVDFDADRRISPGSDYSAGRQVHALDSALRRNRSRRGDRLPELVRRSRESGILVPSTAYIVVENSAQWKMLNRKEKEKLDGNQALDFMEAPAPPVVWVVGVFGVVLAGRSLARRSGGARASRCRLDRSCH